MPFTIPWKYAAIALLALSVVATAYFAISSYNAVQRDNAKLEQALKGERSTKQQLRKNYDNIINATNANDKATDNIVERTNTIVKTIEAQPITTKCVDSPSIQIALEALRQSHNETN